MNFLGTRIDSNWENPKEETHEEIIAILAIRATTFDIEFLIVYIRSH